MRRLIITLALVPLLAFTACAPADDDYAAGDVDTVQINLNEEIRTFRMDVEARLAELDTSIDSLEVEVAEAGEETDTTFDATVAELREERDALQQDLQQLQTSTEATFDDVRADVERRLEELEDDVEEAYAEIRNGNDGAPRS